MKTTTTKTNAQMQSAMKKLFAFAAMGAFTFVPLFSAQAPTEAQPRYDSRRNNNWNNRHYQTYTGRVTNVRSDSRFDLQVGNTTYDVYVSTRVPRRLNRGDIVRVYGQRSGSDDIRNASVAIVNDRNNNRNDNWSNRSYQTYTGRVTNVRSDSRFDLQVGNTTYDVYVSTRVPRRLNRGDIVRVYGQRSGSDDIRNASVAIVRNR